MQHGLEGAAWLTGCSMAYRVQHGLVVSALGCCTAAPGSIPARHPSLDPAGRNYLPRCRSHLPSSGRKNTQQENIPRKNNVCTVLYRNRNYKINKKSAGHGTNILYILSFKPVFKNIGEKPAFQKGDFLTTFCEVQGICIRSIQGLIV